MDVPHLQTHRDSAVALWRQRAAWRTALAIGERALLHLERRLHLHLHVLAHAPAEPAGEPRDAETAAVALAGELSSPDPERRQAAAVQAGQWLAGEIPPLREAAAAVLALFPGKEVDDETRRLYDSEPELRATLVDIWRIQGAEVPRGLLNQGELHARDAELQKAVLRYCAESPAAGLSLFQPYYASLGEDPFGPLPAEPALLAEALRGGLLRGDPEAGRALRRAIERAPSTAEAAPLLRLAALSGEADFHPVLVQHARSEPQGGLRLLALWGRREAVPELLAALESPRDNAAAAEAWQLLFGNRLPRRPRLQVVGEAPDAAAEPEARIADADAAGTWWETHHEDWPPEQRRLAGRPLDRHAIRAWLAADAGRGSAEALDLLALQMGQPVGVARENWLLRRLEVLESVAGAETLPEAGHA